MPFIRILFAVYLFAIPAMAQDSIVGHFGFDDIQWCPEKVSDLDAYPPLEAVNYISPFLFNICAKIPEVGVPVNSFGYQHAFSTNGYSIISIENDDPGNLTTEKQRIFQLKLPEPLIQYAKYKVSFYLSFADSSTTSASRIGIDFHYHEQYRPFVSSIPKSIGYLETQKGVYFEDSVGWMRVEFDYEPYIGDRYLTIGIYNSADSSVANNANPYLLSAYYIDDVQVKLIESSSKPPEVKIFIPNAFVPNNDGLEDMWNFVMLGIEEIDLSIFDRQN